MNRDRLEALLGDPDLRPLLDRLEQRVRRGLPLTGAITLQVTPAQRAAIAALLGRPVRDAASTSVRLDEVDRVVRDSGAAPGVGAALETLRGPVPVAADLRAREHVAWERVYAPLDRYAAVRAELAALPRALRATGALKAVSDGPEQAADLIRDLVAVLEALPTRGETLAAFSARVLHRAHALDVGGLRGLVEAALGELAGREPGDPDGGREDRDAERWAAVGVSLDTLASSVLVHALRFDRSEPVGAALDGLAGTAQPVLVTLRMLLAGARPLAEEVFVCENPAVLVTAADRFGTACAPIVCVRGQPSVAARRLLGALAGSGAVLRYHGDFDWGGIRIGNAVMQRFGAVPWRFGAEDLRAATVPGDALAGDRVEAVWDPGLADAVASRGARLEEEQVLEALLADLAR